MKTIDNGWGDTENLFMSEYNTSVEVCVCFENGVPERVSVDTDGYDDSSISDAAVRRTLTELGWTRGQWEWEAGERGEGVAFVRDLVEVSP